MPTTSHRIHLCVPSSLTNPPFPRASEGETPRAFKKRNPGNACNSRAGKMPRAAPRALTPDPNPAKPTHYDSDVTTYARTPSPANGKNASIFPPQPLSSPERGSRLPNHVGAQAPGPPVPAWTRGVAGGRGEPFRVTRPVPRPLIYRAREQRPPQITWKRGRSRGKACGPCSHLRAVGERLTMSARSLFLVCEIKHISDRKSTNS